MKKSLLICLILGLLCVSFISGCARKTRTDSKSDSTTNEKELITENEASDTIEAASDTIEEDKSVSDYAPGDSDVEYHNIEPVNTVPKEFENIIENDIFNNIVAFDDVLLKSEMISWDKNNHTNEYKIKMMDLYGADIAEYTISADDSYTISTLTATDDGGFLFVLGFNDRYYYEQDMWASEKGFASRVIKCDRSGNVEFDAPFVAYEKYSLQSCFELYGKFYFFGELQTPETKKLGIHSPTDICGVILNENGELLKSLSVAGSDYDSFRHAEILDGNFVLTISSQSDDGDFLGSDSNGYPVDWVIIVNEDLEVTEKKRESGRDVLDYRIGEKDGVQIYKSESFFNGFDGGDPKAFIDYGDFYLIVSTNKTGIYEHTPLYISSIWYYTETVYSAYDYNENLIFRASVDSTPNYASYVEMYSD